METSYLNTDFDLRSASPFDALHAELDAACCVLHYTQGKDGFWYSTVESAHEGDDTHRNAEMDIHDIIAVINSLSPQARREFDCCELREFNMGFDCGDTWAYVHSLPAVVIQAVADTGCSLALTLYPMRNCDGTPRQ